MDTIERQQISRELRARILNVLPSASYQMDRFLSLVDVVYSDTTQSAAISCGMQPVLLVNKKFLDKYCVRDEHLFMLVLHELYHLILGHTRLFPRATRAHNIVFDAVVNALLCQQFRDPIYLEFFKKLNPAKQLPGCLLRPPDEWPENLDIQPKINDRVAKVIKLLYGPKSKTVTYHEILELLGDSINNLGKGGLLIGDHSSENGAGDQDIPAIADKLMTDILRQTVKGWPNQGGQLPGQGDHLSDWLFPEPLSPRSEFLRAFISLLRSARIIPPDFRTRYHWKTQPSVVMGQTVIWDPHDRLSESRSLLYGRSALLFSTETSRPQRQWKPIDKTHVYIDISGSMVDQIPWLVGVLKPLLRNGSIDLYGFSTVVDKIKLRNGSFESATNTFGTDINCVLSHLLSQPRIKTPSKVVIITDGYTGWPDETKLQQLNKKRTRFFIGIVGSGSEQYLAKVTKKIVQLPSPN